MALAVEDGTGKSDAESYLSETDCDAYNLKHENDAVWIALASEAKEIALRRATQYLDNEYRNRWKGTANSETQALAWPRYDAETYDGYIIDSSSLPQALLDATAEAAIKFGGGTNMIDDVSNPGVINMKREKAAIVEEETHYMGGAEQRTMYTLIEALLRDLILSSAEIRRA